MGKGDDARTVRIACMGAITVPLEDLRPLQDGIKELDPQDYQEMRGLIIEHGYCLPIKAWCSDEGEYWIIGGHQTATVLRGMRDEGWVVPWLPISLVEARSIEEAREIVLIDASTYGREVPEKLQRFLNLSGIAPGKFAKKFRMLRPPKIELPEFNRLYFMDGITGKAGHETSPPEEQPPERVSEDAGLDQQMPPESSPSDEPPPAPPEEPASSDALPPPPRSVDTFHHECPRCGYLYD